MALGLGRTPGHSGTDFKHRKAFFGIKAHKKRWRNSTSEDSPPTLQSYTQIKRDRDLKKQTETIRVLILIIPILVMANLFVWSFEALYPKFLKERYAKHQEFVELEKAIRIAQYKDNGYEVLTRSGEMFLDAGELDYAQKEFARAVRVYPYNKRANIGMTKILLKKCSECQMYCAAAEQYLDFLNSLNEVTGDDIMNIEDFAFAN